MKARPHSCLIWSLIIDVCYAIRTILTIESSFGSANLRQYKLGGLIKRIIIAGTATIKVSWRSGSADILSNSDQARGFALFTMKNGYSYKKFQFFARFV